MTRSITLIAAVGAAAVLAGCAGTGVGVAARLGDDRITDDAVVEHVDRGLDAPAARRLDRADVQRAWVSQLLKARLYREGAQRLGALPAEAELAKLVDGYILRSGGQRVVEEDYAARGVDPVDLRPVIESTVLHELIGDALVRDVATPDERLRAEYARRLAELDQAHIAHIKVKDKATADGIAAQVRAGGDFAELAKQSDDVRTAPTGGDLGVVGNGPGPFAREIVQAVFQAKTGDILGPIKVSDGYEIVRVVERVTLSFEDARDLLRAELVKDEREKRRSEYLRELADEIGVSVSPRYGRWDDKAFRVVDGDGLSSPEASLAPADGP